MRRTVKMFYIINLLFKIYKLISKLVIYGLVSSVHSCSEQGFQNPALGTNTFSEFFFFHL